MKMPVYSRTTTQLMVQDESLLDASLFDPDNHLYLAIEMADEYFGINIHRILEVKPWAEMKIRPLVKAPPFLLGVFNLRGQIIPVVDLRLKWDCNTDKTTRTAVVVLEINKRLYGIVVDSIVDVIGVRNEEIMEPPSFNNKLDVQYFQGLTHRHDHTVILLDIERLMTADELGLIDTSALNTFANKHK